jgi:hypothetical protein
VQLRTLTSAVVRFAFLFVALAVLARPAHADDVKPSKLDVHMESELAGYQDTTATTVITPSIAGVVSSPTQGWSVGGNYLVDVVSAASPDIISTASRRWEEVRNAGSVYGTYKPHDLGGSAVVAVSSTPDYLSLNAGGQIFGDLDQKNLTLLGGYTFGHDVIGRTGTSFSVFSHQLDIHTLTASATRVVNPRLVVTGVADLVIERGDQSKPYRYIPLFSPSVAPLIPRAASAALVAADRSQLKPLEQLPLGRERYALTGRLAYRFAASTLRAEERVYLDSWGQPASTTDLRYLADISSRVRLGPHVRFNLQGPVSFWQRAYVTTGNNEVPALRTGDRELGSLATVTGGGSVRWAVGPRGDVDAWAMNFTLDVAYTNFFDALYIGDRLAALSAFTLERNF